MLKPYYMPEPEHENYHKYMQYPPAGFKKHEPEHLLPPQNMSESVNDGHGKQMHPPETHIRIPEKPAFYGGTSFGVISVEVEYGFSYKKFCKKKHYVCECCS